MFFFLLPHNLKKKFKKRRTLLWLLELVFILIFICALFTVIFKYVEKVTWMEAIWQVWQTATTVGYGNKPAETVAGRWVTIFFGMVSIGIMGTAISAIFDYRENMREQRRLGQLDNPYKNGIVIFNFPGIHRFRDFVNELRTVEPDLGICVVDDKIDELPESIAIMPNVHLVRGSILDESTYHRSRIRDNKLIVIFPVDQSSSQSDATTRVVVDLVSKFARKETRIIHLLVDTKNCWLFDGLKSTPVMDSLEILALVQECQDIYSAAIVQRLLLNTEGADPNSVKPNLIVGWTWGELQIHLVEAARNMKTPVNLLALCHDNIPDSCPNFDIEIKEGDTISIIANKKFKWDKFEEELVRSKGT